MIIMSDGSGLLLSLGIALGLGLLVGLQREWENNRMAGLRTFALVSVSGALSAILAGVNGGWVMAAALLGLGALVSAGHLTAQRGESPDPGLTTVMAMFVMFMVGALTVYGYLTVSAAVAGTVMVLLHEKESLHRFVHKIGEKALREIARLVLIGLVILPLLPDEALGGNKLLNPFSIWLMVVLIVGISLAAYLASRFLGNATGALVAGVLGGLISSTATTVSAARQSKQDVSRARSLAVIVLIAGSVVFARVMVEVALVAPSHAWEILPPLGAMMVFSVLVAAVAYRAMLRAGGAQGDAQPSSELKGAVVFGMLYVLVLVAVSYAKDHFGDAGLFTVAAFSGLTDMDAITLSTAGLSQQGDLDPTTAWRVILTGGLANVVFKAVLVSVIGSKELLKPALAGFGAILLGGTVILWFWP